MSLSRLFIEVALKDGVSAGAKKIALGLASIPDALGRAQETFARFAGPGLRAAAEMQDALVNLELSLDPTSVRDVKATVADLYAEAAKVAGPTPFSATQMAGVQAELLKGGMSVGDTKAVSSAVGMLAAAEAMPLEQATAAALTMASIFGLQGKELREGAELMAAASAASKMNAAQLAEAVSQAPSAAAFGMRDAFGLLGVLHNRGIEGSRAGTSLEAFYSRAALADKKYGVNMFGDQGQFLGAENAASVLKEKFGGMNQRDQTLALQKVFGDVGKDVALALIQAPPDKNLAAVLTSMQGQRSLAEKTTMRAGTYSGQVEALRGSIDTTLGTLFQPVLAPLTEFATKGNELVSRIGAWAGDNPFAAKAVSGGAVGLAGVVGIGALLTSKGGGALGSAAGVGAGLAAGKLAEQAGAQPVFVVNWPGGAGGLPGLGGAGAPAAGSGLLGTVAKTAGVTALAGEIGVAASKGMVAAVDALAGDSRLGKVVQLGLANAMLYGPGRLFLDEGQGVADAKKRQREGVDTLKQAIGLKVDVHVDRDGNATVISSADKARAVARAAARQGNP